MNLQSKDFRRTRINGWYEFIRIACPVCNHTGGCMINKEGDRVACIRIESEYPFSKNSSLPSYLHFLKGNEKRPKIILNNVDEIQGNEKRSDGELNTIYQSMLSYLSLSDEHYEHLIAPNRGLSDSEIMTRQYATFPDRPWSIVRKVSEQISIKSFEGVPGFYQQKGKYGEFWSVNGQNSILIPYRNIKNEITGFQYRLDQPPNTVKIQQMSGVSGLRADIKQQPNLVQVSLDGEILEEREMKLNETISIEKDGKTIGFVTLKKGNRYYWLSSATKTNGTGAGNPAPVHVSVPTHQLSSWKTGEVLKRKKVWLSEGALKCDIATNYIHRLFEAEEISMYGDTFIALPGVNAWQVAIPLLKEMGVEEINLCFDSDITSNLEVQKVLKNCIAALKENGYHVNMVMWNKKDGKGIDDLFINHTIPKFHPLF